MDALTYAGALVLSVGSAITFGLLLGRAALAALRPRPAVEPARTPVTR